MKTESTITIEKETDFVIFGYWLDEEEFIEATHENAVEVAARLQCSEELVGALVSLVNIIKDLVGNDLDDIWKRLEGLTP